MIHDDIYGHIKHLATPEVCKEGGQVYVNEGEMSEPVEE